MATPQLPLRMNDIGHRRDFGRLSVEGPRTSLPGPDNVGVVVDRASHAEDAMALLAHHIEREVHADSIHGPAGNACVSCGRRDRDDAAEGPRAYRNATHKTLQRPVLR